MARVRTAISLDEELLHEVDELAQRMKLSRSEVFARAAKDFVHKQESRQMLAELNPTYGEPDADEQDLALHMKALRRRVAED